MPGITLTPPTASSAGEFAALVHDAARGSRFSDSRAYARDLGLDEPALLRYASGAVSMYERQEIEQLVLRCEWARDFVIDHMKRQRKKDQRAVA
jgi:hypothetical protein